ncbi:MAG: hemolysin family protein [Bacilli bacterium]|nr:hemolysin family protein [Bacilli bacterium]
MVPLTSINNSILLSSLLLNIPFFIALIILLVFSAFFSANETAYSSVNIIRIKKYQEDKIKGANKAVFIAEKFDLTLTTVLVGNNIVNISATTISVFIFNNLISNPTASNILSTIFMTIIVLIFGEILPKSTTKINPEKFVLRYSGLMYFFIKLLFPITFFFLKLSKALSSKNKNKNNNPLVTENELESIIDVMETEGVIDEDDADLIQSAISLNTRSVYDIMTPRVDMVAININDSIERIKEKFFKYQFSRVPVYENDKDNIIGILSERDFFTSLLKNKETKLSELLVTPLFVLETTKVDDLIREMQKQKKHFAIVLDEYGGTSGIVTMEDALEELVGEIYDEYDDENGDLITEIEPNKYLVSSEASLEELFDDLKIGKIPDAKYTSVGGFLYEISDEVPYEGKVIKYNSSYEEHDLENPVYKEYELVFTISKVDHRRIRNILLEIIELKKVEDPE